MGAFTDYNKLVGICGLVKDLRLKARHRGEIVQMYVEPSFAGQGIGRTLLRLTIERAFPNAQIEQIILSVVHTNDKAVKLYKQPGFMKYGRLENYFKKRYQVFYTTIS